jgi:hypothetical protein
MNGFSCGFVTSCAARPIISLHNFSCDIEIRNKRNILAPSGFAFPVFLRFVLSLALVNNRL